MSRRTLRTLALGGASLLCALLVAELLVRANRTRLGLERSQLWDFRAYVSDGRSRFRPAAYVGWTFDPERPGVNSDGFIGPETPRARTPGIPRIACLGGSTTAGNVYLGYAASYPGALSAVLEERLGHPVEVLNFGVAGWTTAESLVNWQLCAKDYRPDLVVIHHAVNDVLPRLAPGFRGDYRHYTHPWAGRRYSPAERWLVRWSDLYAWLRLRSFEFDLATHVALPSQSLSNDPGALRPETRDPFRRNLASLARDVRASGAEPVLMTMPCSLSFVTGPLDELRVTGMAEHDAIARELSAEHGWALFDLAQSADPALRASFVDLVHLTPQGYRRKAELLADFLLERGLLPR
jgi:lysophospholipase L1-like esterase